MLRRVIVIFHRLVFILAFSIIVSGCMAYRNIEPNDPNWGPSLPSEPDLSKNNPGTIYNPQTAQMLFQDKRALRVGDIITIVLTEKTNASKTADTAMKKDDSNSMSAPTVLGSLPSAGKGHYDLSLSTDIKRAFKSETDSAQSNSLQGTITVTVQKVFANGNLYVKGEKWISLNQGDEFIRVSGLIRPEDIDKDNQVASTRIADARIIYGGRGPLAESNEVGWLSRFFNSGWWPF